MTPSPRDPPPPRGPSPAADVRLSIDTWAPGWGSAMEAGELERPVGAVDVTAEFAPADWRPLTPPDRTPVVTDAVFVDGVRRIDARVWVTPGSGRPGGALAVSIGAGAVRTNARAAILDARVDRLVIGPAGTPGIDIGGFVYRPVASGGDDDAALIQTLQNQLRQLERRVLDDLDPAPLVVVDGPLEARRHADSVIGYVKTHHTGYLDPTVVDTVADLLPGTRTPVFVVTDNSRSRCSWYLRLPTVGAPGHPWAGVVRIEIPADRPFAEVVALADVTAASLPRFASRPHRDPRAPQNLVPIAGLETQLKHRLGDARLLERRLRAAVGP